MKSPLIFKIAIVLLLSACSPGIVSPQTTADQTTPVFPTPIVGTAIADQITGVPIDTTPQPTPTFEPPTPIPTLPSGASPTELKYMLLDQYPDFFYCDPDYYPVQIGDETQLAIDKFPVLQENEEEFQAILKNNNLEGLTTFTDEQMLLIYQEHKKLAAISFQLADESYQFQLQVAESEGEGMVVTGLVDGNGSITLLASQPGIVSCPICLAAGTLIGTPRGPVPVQELRVGDYVWSVDGSGGRFATRILKTSRAVVPVTHQVIHVILDDGRELWASPGHPLAGGGVVNDLATGNLLDGARVSRIERITYDQPATFDILPAGETGWYWANGILMGSALAIGD